MKNKYSLLFKTGDAELRALEKTKFDIDKIFPIIELTRGRRSKSDQIGLISKRIQKLATIFSGGSICLDLTTHDSLTNSEIDELYNPENGYSNWINFLKDLNTQDIFNEIVPTILVDTSDTKLNENLKKQVQQLSNSFSKLVYRNNIIDNGCYDDIKLISEQINANAKHEFIFIIDCEYVPSGAYPSTINVVNARITKIKALIPKAKFIVISTSFPRYVSDIGNDDYDLFPLNEIDIFKGVKLIHPEILYGDYGSINPIRNDDVVMANGWIPRVDVPTINGIYYYRIRNTIKDYARTYSIVAKKAYCDSKFPKNLMGNWGINQIAICKDGSSPGSSPSYWISVRMSIFISMQLNRLN